MPLRDEAFVANCESGRLKNTSTAHTQHIAFQTGSRGDTMRFVRIALILLLTSGLLIQAGLTCEDMAEASPALTCCTGLCPGPGMQTDCCKVSYAFHASNAWSLTKRAQFTATASAPIHRHSAIELGFPSQQPESIRSVETVSSLKLLCSLQI